MGKKDCSPVEHVPRMQKDMLNIGLMIMVVLITSSWSTAITAIINNFLVKKEANRWWIYAIVAVTITILVFILFRFLRVKPANFI